MPLVNRAKPSLVSIAKGNDQTCASYEADTVYLELVTAF